MSQLKDREIMEKVGADMSKELMIFNTVNRFAGIFHSNHLPVTEEDFLNYRLQNEEITKKLEHLATIAGMNTNYIAYDSESDSVIFNSELFITDNFALTNVYLMYEDGNTLMQQMFELYFKCLHNSNVDESEITIETLIANGLSHRDVETYLQYVALDVMNEDEERELKDLKSMFELYLQLIETWEQLKQADSHYKERLDNMVDADELTMLLLDFGEHYRAMGVEKITRYCIANPNPNISMEDLYDMWREGYQFNEKGFLGFRKSFDLLYNRNYKKVKERVDKLRPLCDKAGFIEIYRGESANSTPSKQAMSWTLSKNVACSFGFRNRSTEYRLVYGKVHIDSIYDTFIQDSSLRFEELEVIVEPTKVKIIETVKVDDTNGLITNLSLTKAPPIPLSFVQNHGKSYYDIFKNALVTFESLNEKHDLFVCSDLHGFGHSSRVLLHAITNGFLYKEEYKLRGVDIAILVVSAMLHDIGREHDEEDLLHGQLSVEKTERLGINYLGLQGEDMEITKFIMANHNIPDNLAMKNLKASTTIRNKKRAKQLYNLFCDADGLDRVRLGDLDITYLRHDKTKLLVGYAEDVLRQFK